MRKEVKKEIKGTSKNKKRIQERGITLVALVITIIIIIILATVTINMAFGENGLIKQAQLAKDLTANSIEHEGQSTSNLIHYMNEILKDKEQIDANKIPISTSEQLLKLGSGEEIEIDGKKYKFDLDKTYVLQNNIEFTGAYDNIANLIQNNKVNLEGQGHQILVTNTKGVKEYYTEDSKYYIATNVQGYVLKGLELYYDGIDNDGIGVHSNTTTTWKDLSGNNRDGTLNNFGTSAISGWNNEYLSFDGVNDWVGCGELNNARVTVEAVHRIRSNARGDRSILGNWENGGSGLYTVKGNLMGNAYINKEYHTVNTGVNADVYKNKIMTSSLTYDGINEKIYVDGEEKASATIEGDIQNPENNTIMMIGTNGYGDSIGVNYGDLDVYTVRIYSRGLSNEEIEINNKADNRRFKQYEVIPVYTEQQLLKIGSGEQVFVEQDNKTYDFGTGKKYELKNDIEVKGNYSGIINRINNKEVEIILNNYKINNNGIFYTTNSKFTIGVNKYGYVSNGLQLLYDGTDNIGEGNHNPSATVWKDLSGNNRDGVLKNIDTTSCWQNDGLKFDGVDDFVLIAEMNYNNVTLESVNTVGKNINSGGMIVSNTQNGGYSLIQYDNNRFTFGSYILENSAYKYVQQNTQLPINDFNIKRSIHGSYDGKTMKLRTSNNNLGGITYQETEISGTIGKTEDNTYMVLGMNPQGTMAREHFYDGIISSVRIYNRALSDEENAVNYLNDRDKYGL